MAAIGVRVDFCEMFTYHLHVSVGFAGCHTLPQPGDASVMAIRPGLRHLTVGERCPEIETAQCLADLGWQYSENLVRYIVNP